VRDIVSNGITKDVLECLVLGDILALFSDDDDEFAFIVHFGGLLGQLADGDIICSGG
jgi:hypothetical protein